MSKPTLTESDLWQFTGTEHWYRHALVRNVSFTDGAKYLADHAGAYWLLDIIAIAQAYTATVATEDFQAWRLTVNANASATVVCTDGNDKERYRQVIPFTDFPLPDITLYCCRDDALGRGIDWVILLPREY
jgi:hypothetical protein